MSKRKTLEEFISEASQKHNNKYSYEAITTEIWEQSGTSRIKKVPITCPEHGIFWQAISNHLNKGSNGKYHGCPICAKLTIKSQTNNPRNLNKKHYGKKTTEEFNFEAKQIHGDRYEYLEDYINAKVPIKMKCKICGNVFKQSPDHHINRKDGCPVCRNKYFSESQQYSKEKAEQLINEAIGEDKFEILEYHGFNKYDSLMRCKKCGFEFWRTPINGQREKCQCPNCDNMSKGETETSRILNKFEIKYILYYKTEWLGLQSLDFFLPEYNIGIEYDGIQHFEPVSTFGGEEAFKIQQERDNRKSQLCEENGVKLIRIPYWDFDNIEAILKENILPNDKN